MRHMLQTTVRLRLMSILALKRNQTNPDVGSEEQVLRTKVISLVKVEKMEMKLEKSFNNCFHKVREIQRTKFPSRGEECNTLVLVVLVRGLCVSRSVM